MGVICAWSIKALQDGKVTLNEALELVSQLCDIVGVPTEMEISQDAVEDRQSLPQAT